MEEAQDISMVDEDEQRDEVEARLPLSEDEQRVLDLYDQLQQLRLEIEIINAQSSYKPSIAELCPPRWQKKYTNIHVATSHKDEAVSAETQQALLEARANFRLRNDVVESVMTANPILKAVHNGTNAAPAEK